MWTDWLWDEREEAGMTPKLLMGVERWMDSDAVD